VCQVDTTRDQEGGASCTPCPLGYSTRGTVNSSSCQMDDHSTVTTSGTSVTTSEPSENHETSTVTTPETTVVTVTSPETTVLSVTTPEPVVPAVIVEIYMDVTIPLAIESDTLTSVINRIISIIANNAGVSKESVTIKRMVEYEEASRRRLLASGVIVEFVISIPVIDEPIATTVTNSKRIASRVTTSSVNEAIKNNQDLNSILPEGVIAVGEPVILANNIPINTPTPTGDTEDISPILVIIIGAVTTLFLGISIILGVWCCCCKATRHGSIIPTAQYASIPLKTVPGKLPTYASIHPKPVPGNVPKYASIPPKPVPGNVPRNVPTKQSVFTPQLPIHTSDAMLHYPTPYWNLNTNSVSNQVTSVATCGQLQPTPAVKILDYRMDVNKYE
jgi:hypothetical protein